MLLECRNPHLSLYPLMSLVPGSVRSGCKEGADGLDKSFLVAEDGIDGLDGEEVSHLSGTITWS